MTAIESDCSYNIIKLLIDKGANINHRNDEGNSVIMKALEYESN